MIMTSFYLVVGGEVVIGESPDVFPTFKTHSPRFRGSLKGFAPPPDSLQQDIPE